MSKGGSDTVGGHRMISIYKSPRSPETYLYVTRGQIGAIPDALAGYFGKPVHVTDMLLHPARKLARADASRVLEQIDEVGYYLQMPPQKEDYLLDNYRDTSDRYKGLL